MKSCFGFELHMPQSRPATETSSHLYPLNLNLCGWPRLAVMSAVGGVLIGESTELGWVLLNWRSTDTVEKHKHELRPGVESRCFACAWY